MNREEIEGLVERGIEEIAINAQSLADAKPRAGRMLTRVAVLTNYLRYLEEELPKLQTLVNAQYALAIQQAGGKNITEKKVEAEASQCYSDAVEKKAVLDAQRDWVKNYVKIFDNAHIMYRQYSRDE
jgi:hypothetical protein